MTRGAGMKRRARMIGLVALAALATGCDKPNHYLIANSVTVIGVEVGQNPATQTPTAKLGYNRSELAIVPTNRDLRQMIREDCFREDLYFRINTFEIRLPPLRERNQDIPDLARHLLGRAAHHVDRTRMRAEELYRRRCQRSEAAAGGRADRSPASQRPVEFPGGVR